VNPKLKAKWVKALRSDKFKQGREDLYNPHDQTHCCLGVLCRVAGKSDAAIKWMAFPSTVGFRLLDHEIERELASLNDLKDDQGNLIPVPFEMIAGLIEEAL
jgi:hypothetical protein